MFIQTFDKCQSTTNIIFHFLTKCYRFQISQVMYIKLRKAEIEKEEENRKFIEEFGEEAFKEKKRLL